MKRFPSSKRATIRPDGGHNICSAEVLSAAAPKPRYNDSMVEFCGCCRNSYENLTLWQCDSEWSEKRIGEDFLSNSTQNLMLLKNLLNGSELSSADYARLAERGYISVLNKNGNAKAVLQAVVLQDSETVNNLMDIGGKIKEKHWDEMCRLKDKYASAVLAETPAHLRNARSYGLQHIFFSDPWFILHILKHLTENGKLKLPTNAQKKMLMTVITMVK